MTHLEISVICSLAYPYHTNSSKRLPYTAIGGTCKNTIGGTQWENF